MKKVLYNITALSHKRVFESFEERNDMDQMLVGPEPRITGHGIVPEDYRDIKLKKIKTYKTKDGLQKLIDSFCPDIYVEASLPISKDIKLPKKCKKVYVSHGMVGNHVRSIVKKAGINASVWKGCDLYCGATSIFSDWVKYAAGVGEDKILLNAIPQLDILHNSAYYDSYKGHVLHKLKKSPDKIILFAGFCCRDRCDFEHHNEDYFKVAIELSRIAEEKNWLIMIKPRQTNDKMIRFLNIHSWGNKYLDQYEKVIKSKNVHFVTTTGHIYRYFFADAIVINGTSTVEVEAAAIKKPLLIVRTGCDKSDPHQMISSGSATGIFDINDLRRSLQDCIAGQTNTCVDNQIKWFKDRGLTLDGLMHKRIQDRIILL